MVENWKEHGGSGFDTGQVKAHSRRIHEERFNEFWQLQYHIFQAIYMEVTNKLKPCKIITIYQTLSRKIKNNYIKK